MEPDRLRNFVRSCAVNLGFNAVGISRVSAIPPAAMTGWLEKKYHGRMSYLERNLGKRLDPRKILAGARSLVSVALNYLHPVEMPYLDSNKGVISKYARGVDYHFVMEEKLAQLLKQLVECEPSTVGKVYTDTGPVMDKYWAVKSGLGWLGKHTNVLSRENGSWFFIGEIILNLDLDPDRPGSDFCGSCTRCIDACPTGAIVKPYVLDARKCISYSTIEHKEDVPHELRRATENLVFGCDICQDVCPWNRKAPTSGVKEFDDSGRDYALISLARLTPGQFSKSFRLSPVKRTKWRGLMRNVAVAMGNSRAAEGIPELTDLLHCEDAMVRRHAAWALGQIGGSEGKKAVEQRLAVEDDEKTIVTLRESLRSHWNVCGRSRLS